MSKELKKFFTGEDLAWGCAAIGEEINRTPEQVSAMFRAGVFGDAVQKLGHKTICGSRSKLRARFSGVEKD
jgi:hypothetical protein